MCNMVLVFHIYNMALIFFVFFFSINVCVLACVRAYIFLACPFSFRCFPVPRPPLEFTGIDSHLVVIRELSLMISKDLFSCDI